MKEVCGGHVPKRRKREGKGGSSTGMRARIKSQKDARKGGKRTVHEYDGCGIMLWLREDRVLVVLDIDGICRAHSNSDLACIVRASGA